MPYIPNYRSTPVVLDVFGSSCTGTDGQAGRTLTLNNTGTTQATPLLFINGTELTIGDYSYTNGSPSIVTFNNQVFNTDYIRVFFLD